jgi:hypothetical protein
LIKPINEKKKNEKENHPQIIKPTKNPTKTDSKVRR